VVVEKNGRLTERFFDNHYKTDNLKPMPFVVDITIAEAYNIPTVGISLKVHNDGK
jgi:hypothetical protein